MIHNAGVMLLSLLDEGRVDDWDRMIDVNMKGTLYGIAAALPYMKEQKSGHVINVSSTLVLPVRDDPSNDPETDLYNASKWALEAMAENYRSELSGFGVDSCLVEPGGFPTKFMDNLAG